MVYKGFLHNYVSQTWFLHVNKEVLNTLFYMDKNVDTVINIRWRCVDLLNFTGTDEIIMKVENNSESGF